MSHEQRLTCRDQYGMPRLIPGGNLIDAICKLCELEESVFGALMIERAGANPAMAKRCRDCACFKVAANYSGKGICTKHLAKDKHGNITMVQAARFACRKGFEPKKG